MTTFTVESALAGELPDGYDTTLIEGDRLRQLSEADTANLSGVVSDYNSNTLTEEQVVRAEIQRVATSFQTPEAGEGATLDLPGTMLEYNNILQFASYYKADNDTPSGTIKGTRRAGTDDIVFTFANPEVYEEVSGTSQDTFEVDSVTGGSAVDLVGDTGLNETNPGSDTSLSLDSDEMMYFTGDFIDLSGGQSAISKIQWSDIDGEDYGPDDGLFQSRLSSTHVFTGQGAWIKSTADLDAKGYVDGNAEIVPVAFYMGPGSNAPSLV